MATSRVTESEIRIFMMDKAELNSLVSGVRWTPEMISQAVEFTVDRFNMSQPYTGSAYSVETFPYKYLLLMGTASYLLKSAAIGDASNQFSYNADGVNVDDRDKAQIFISLAGQYDQEFRELTQSIKTSQNIAKVYGVVNSEYIFRAF